jgi:hypothetical protein
MNNIMKLFIIEYINFLLHLYKNINKNINKNKLKVELLFCSIILIFLVIIYKYPKIYYKHLSF